MIEALLNLPTYIGVFAINILNMFVAAIAGLCGLIMSLGLKMMDVSIDHFILNMKKWVEIGLTMDSGGIITNPGVIQNGWNIVSNIANMVFIFALLFVAIATIIGMNYKQYLVTIVIAAILVNFSLVATKVLVDLSNVTAVSFYNETVLLAKNHPTTPANTVGAFIKDRLDIDTKFNENNANRIDFSDDTDWDTWRDEDGNPESDSHKALREAIDRIVSNFMKIFFYIIAAYVFYSAALLIITRFIVIIFLMILSPVAFASIPLPQMKSLVFNRWWGSLKNQLLIAPVFFFFFYLVIMIIGTPFPSFETATFSAAFASILSFMIIIGLLLFALQASKELSDSTSNMLTGYLKKGVQRTGAAVGRQAGGKIGQKIASSGALSKLALNKNSKMAQFAGRNMMRLGNTMHGTSWGSGKDGLKAQQETQRKRVSALDVQAAGTFGQKKKAAEKRQKEMESLRKESIDREKKLSAKKLKQGFLDKKEGKEFEKLTGKKTREKRESLLDKSEELRKKAKSFGKTSETLSLNLESMSKQTKPFVKQVEKGHEEGWKTANKEENSKAAKKAREERAGEEYKVAKEVETALEEAIAGNKDKDILKQLKRLNKNHLKLIPKKHLEHPLVAPSLSEGQLKSILKETSPGTAEKMGGAIKEAASDKSNPVQANAKDLVKQIKRINGSDRNDDKA